ncbi:phage/plasmid primase, P4 family [Yersinia enterocolitica]|nr:toprim domain-containing protein [Yersinia enterocolitica]ELI8239939.1 toprim domain-containing protein [Yersinia enterocolitica]HEN3254643.1 toprim domain-containing protein [Yersinia enterocolitica]
MTIYSVSKAVQAAQGQWKSLLPRLGIPVAISGQHTACPICGGKDRFRFDDLNGRGTWICNRCGAGDGLSLVEKALAITAKQAAGQVTALIGHQEPLATHITDHDDKHQQRQRATQLACSLVNQACRSANNSYLANKGWPEYQCLTLQENERQIAGVTYCRGDLIVPLSTLSGELVNIQLINANGDKRTLPGGQVKGAFHLFSAATSVSGMIWLAEGYATGLTVHQLTGDDVYVALSANNLPSLAAQLHEQYPAKPLLIAADRDENGTGQIKAEEAAKVCNGVAALPPINGDWNDIYQVRGAVETANLLHAFCQRGETSPFDSLSEADFKAMSASEKAALIAEHYNDRLAIDAFGETFYQYENGAWKILPFRILSREVAALFQKIRAPFSAAGISGVLDTLKLIIPVHKEPARHLIGFRNGVFNTVTGQFSPHRKEYWLRTVNNVDYTTYKEGENLPEHAPYFWQWLDRAASGREEKRQRILAALFMVLANRYDWQLFLEVTGPGGSGKSVMAEIATLLAGKDNTTAATINTIESSRERSAIVGYSLIILPDQEKWSGDGAGIKAITGGDAVMVDPKYKDAYSTSIPAVILAVNNNPMRFSDRSGGVSRRRVILSFPEVIPVNERDPQMKSKIESELSVIVRYLMQRFANPGDARKLLQEQQNSDEALEIKRNSDPLVDFCGYLLASAEANGLYMGNGNIIPRNPRKYLYHAYLSFMEARGHLKPMTLTAFGLALPQILREYGLALLKRKTKQGMQTNLELSEDCETDWLPKCDSFH